MVLAVNEKRRPAANVPFAAVAARPWWWAGVAAAVLGGLYTVASHAPLRAPIAVPPHAIDAWIPLVPAAAVPYLTYALLLPAVVLLGRALPGFGRVLVSVLACGAVNVALYLAFPTALQGRPPAPHGTLLALIQRLDTSACAIPSGHVSLPVSIAVAAWLESRAWGPLDARRWRRFAAWFAVWAGVLTASALLTKQHYLVDVLAGGALGVAVPWAVRAGSHGRLEDRVPRTTQGEPVHGATLRAIAFEWLVIAGAIASALVWWWPSVVFAALVVIATRQHALLVLYHDGVHFLVARSRRLNDFLTNLAIGVPMLLPVHLYRALHLSHHAHLGTPQDPERVLLYAGQPWRYRPLPLAALVRQLLGDALGWYGLRMSWRYLRERRHPVALALPRTRAYPELALQSAVFALAGAVAWLAWPGPTARVALLWFLPYLTLTQLLQKLRSFAEHAAEGESRDALSYSWRPGMLGRLTIWPYHINYHREHHARPGVPWNELPAAFPSVPQRAGRALGALLWSGSIRRES